MNNADFDADLNAKLSTLDKQKMPERDLWPGIEIALAQQDERAQQDLRGQTYSPVHNKAGKGMSRYAAMAASVALVGMVSFFVMKQSDVTSPDHISGEELVSVLSNQHETEKNALLVKLKDQPTLTENWQQQLTELDEAANAIKAALKQEPNNLALLKMLQNVYQQQINLIETVHSPKWQQI